MFIYSLFILMLLTLNCHASPPSILSSTYHEKKATVLGAEQNYYIFEMNFDQDIYYQENWPCPCINDTSSCNDGDNTTTLNSTQSILELQEDEYFYRTTNFTDISYFKFYLNNSCDIIRLELQSIYGQMQLYASTDGIPYSNNYNWVKYSLQRDSI